MESGTDNATSRVGVIACLAIATVVLLLPPLVLEAQLFASVNRVGGLEASESINALLVSLDVERAGATAIVRTAGTTTLSEFERQKNFTIARTATDDAVAALGRSGPELTPMLKQFSMQLQSMRQAVLRDTTLTVGDAAARFASLRRVASEMHLAVLAASVPRDSRRLGSATQLSRQAMDYARAGGIVRSAHTAQRKALPSVKAAQVVTSRMARAIVSQGPIAALAGADVADQVNPERVRGSKPGVSVAVMSNLARKSIVTFANTSVNAPTAVQTAAEELVAAYDHAQVEVARVRPSSAVELTQLVINCCAISAAVAAACCVVYVFASGVGLDAGAGHDAAIEHMSTAYTRVIQLMDRILDFDCTDMSDISSGPALSAVEAELRGLLKPVANAVAHIPRATLVPTGSEGPVALQAQLDSEPTLCHNVSVLVMDLHFLNDVSYSGDSVKSLPGRTQKLRTAVLSEVLRKGGLPVLTPLNRWAFAWNLHGNDKGGIQSATQCAMNILAAGTVDYPSMRAAVVTGAVASGHVGSSTYRVHLVAGAPVLLAPMALKAAQEHGAGLVVDSETHANCSSQTYRSRAIEVVAPESSAPGVVLYNLLSTLDSHDPRLLQWNEAFEKYHSGRVTEALTGFREWAKEGADPSVRRLISLLEASPPVTVTTQQSAPTMFP